MLPKIELLLCYLWKGSTIFFILFNCRVVRKFGFVKNVRDSFCCQKLFAKKTTQLSLRNETGYWEQCSFYRNKHAWEQENLYSIEENFPFLIRLAYTVCPEKSGMLLSLSIFDIIRLGIYNWYQNKFVLQPFSLWRWALIYK